MDNKIEHFVLKEYGRIYWVEKMPDEPLRTNMGGNDYRDRAFNGAHEDAYKIELQSAIDNAVQVSNQEEVWNKIYLSVPALQREEPKPNKLYSLQCHVEKKEVHTGMVFVNSQTSGSITKTVALVTFSQPEREETQEETYRVLLLASYCGNNENCTENHPCPDCLQMCNVYEVPKPVILLPKCVGQFDQAITRKTP